MAGLGLTVDDLGGYLDKVAQTSRESNTDIDALMEAFVIAGGTFERLNIPLEESNALIGVLANRGFKGAQSGTALNAIITRLASTTGPAANALADMGISAYDSQGNFRGLEVVLKDVERELSSMTDAERSHYQTQLAGLNHGKSFNAMLSGMANEYDDLKLSIIESDGALLDMRNTMKDNLQGALENLSSAFEELLISLGQALMPVVKTLVSWLQNLVDWFNNLSDGTKTTIALTAALAAGLALIGGPLLLIVGLLPTMIAGFTALTTVFTALTSPVVSVVSGLFNFIRNSTLAATAAGVLTGQTSLATAAMIAKSVAAGVLRTALSVLTGPVGWVTAGVGLLVTGIIAAVKWMRRETEESKKLKKETEGLAKATDDLTDSVASSRKAYEESQSSARANTRHTDELIRKIEELSSKENKSAADKHLLKTYTDELNNSIDGLNLAYDVEADMLSASADEMRERLALYKEQEAANAALERTKEIMEEQMQVEERLAEVNAQREEWNRNLDEGTVKVRDHYEEVKKLDEMEEELKETLGELTTEYEQMETQVNESMNAIAEVTERATERQIIAYDDLSDEHKSMVDDMQSNWQDLAKTSTNVFDKIDTDSEMTFKKMKENFEHNRQVTADWAKNLEELAQAGVSSAFLDTFREMGPKSAAEVQALVDADIEEVKKLGEGFEKQTKDALDQMAQAYNLDKNNFDAIRVFVEDIGMTFDQALKMADFSQYGENIVFGTADGIISETPRAVDSMERLSDGLRKSFEISNEIRSPSRLYKRFGEYLAEGLRVGIDGKSSQVINRVSRLTADMTRQFRGINNNFRSIGGNAMAGLSAGLNAGVSSVMARARSIANSVTNTIKSALRIHSPSRIMRDEIGRWIPEGLAQGIEKSIRVVERASEYLAQVATPEIDMSYATPDGISTTLASAVTGTVDVNSRDDMISQAIDNLGNKLENLRIEMDRREFGRFVNEEINEGRNGSIRGGGRRRI